MSETEKKEKTWIYYLIQFLIFGPMLGLLVFSVYITRIQSVPMILIAISGVCFGKVAQLIVLKGVYIPPNRNIVIISCLAFGTVTTVVSAWLAGHHALLSIALLCSLFFGHAIYTKHRASKNA